jgi:localization factor PodJL
LEVPSREAPDLDIMDRETPVFKGTTPAPEPLDSDERQAFQASALRANLKAQAVAQSVFAETIAEAERAEPRGSVAERVVARLGPPSGSGPRPWLLVAACCGLMVGLGFLLVDFLTARSPVPAPVATAGPHAAAPAFKDDGRVPAAAAVAPAETVPVAPPPPTGATPANAMPGYPPPARSRPETVTDDLSLATPPTKSNSAHTVRVNGVPAPDVPQGIEIETAPTGANAAEIALLRQRQRMAAVSTRLGAQAPPPAGELGTSAIAASLTREMPAAAQPQDSVDRAGLVLPPAMIGPLSLRLAAAKGDPSAEFEVAARYAEGKGVTQDFKQAQVWYQRSAAQGFAQAQYRLATLYERGLGVTIDTGKARVWYSRAAEQGNVKAMHNLAVLAAGRQGGTPDYATAARWFGEAARRGLSDSQFNLAVLTENGLGAPKSVKDAYLWFSLAARGSDPEAMRRRDQVRAKLAAADIAAVDKAVGEWHPEAAPALVNDPRTAGEAWKERKDQTQGN